MMKKVLLVLMMAALCLAGGCKVKVQTEETPFDMAQAEELITRVEEPVLELYGKETVPRIEYDALLKDMNMFLQEKAANIVDTFFDGKELADESIQELKVVQENFYPTILHNGFEIAEAKTVKTTEADGTVTERLEIREEYTGDNEKMQQERFSRTYIFKKEENAFLFEKFEGTLNYMGTEYDALKNDLK